MLATPIILSLVFGLLAEATPVPAIPPCVDVITYSVSNTDRDVLGSHPSLVPMDCSNGGSSCSLGAQFTYTVSWAVNVGISLNLGAKDIASQAGLTAGYTYGAATGEGDSATFTCPSGGNWDCALVVTPRVAHVTGFQIKTNTCTQDKSQNAYDVEYPIIENNLPDVHVELCICPNGPDTNKAGHPPVCFKDC